MIFDTTRTDIILVSYPSGGFGNFIYHALTEHAALTVKYSSKFSFSETGNSHGRAHYCNTYYKDPTSYLPSIINDCYGKILVLCDNGILNDSYHKINTVFPNATIVRLVIDKAARPVIYRTMIEKALESNLSVNAEPHIQTNWSDSNEDYATRENFTLMYHSWEYGWEYNTSQNIVNVPLLELITKPTECITKLINKLHDTVIHPARLQELCNTWLTANNKYFAVFYIWQKLNLALDNGTNYQLTVTDLHDQGYLNYCIESKFNVIIPVYDYKDWFTSSTDIIEMIKCLKSRV